jgi:hypothetical protein
MRKNLLPLFSVSLALSMPLPGIALGQLGDGELRTEVRRTLPFGSIEMSGVGKLRVERGSQHRVELRLDSNLLAHYVVESRGGVLRLGFERGFAVGRVTDLEVVVTMPELEGLSLSGSAEAEIGGGFGGREFAVEISGAASVRGPIDCASLRASISGAGSAELRGKAGKLRVEISGAGSFEGRNLSTVSAAVEVSGTGRVLVQVEKRLEVDLSGAASVRYWGDPTVEKHMSGAASVIRAGGS